MTTLRQGSRGPEVVRLQKLLNQKLNPSPRLVEDGIFGPKTSQAVLRYQGQHGLVQDGIVGPKTWGALQGGGGGGSGGGGGGGGGQGTVSYGKTVSDAHVRTILQRIADFYGRTVTVSSGDRDYVPPGGSTKSLHLAHRAADFHVSGTADADVFEAMKNNIGRIFSSSEGYEFIRHGPYTNTSGAHLHIGHYNGTHAGYVLFKTEGLTAGSGGSYNVVQHAIQ